MAWEISGDLPNNLSVTCSTMNVAPSNIIALIPSILHECPVTWAEFDEAANLTVPNHGISAPATPTTQSERTASTLSPFSSVSPPAS